MVKTEFFILGCVWMWLSFLQSGDCSLVRVDLDSKEHQGTAHANSFYVGGSSHHRFIPDLAFTPKGKDKQQFWQADGLLDDDQVLWYRFENPIPIVMIDLNSCSSDSYDNTYCAGNQWEKIRENMGPKDFDVVAAWECDTAFELIHWTTLRTERGKQWTGDSEATLTLKGHAKHRCYGIRVLNVRCTQASCGSGERAVIANLKMYTIQCEKPQLPEMAQSWNCGKAQLGQECIPNCRSGYTSVGTFTCKRDEEDSKDGHFKGDAVCEFQCTRPEVEGGYLQSCNRPVDGHTCTVACETGYSDLNQVTCSRDSPEALTFKWKLDNRHLDHALLCLEPQASEDCVKQTSCNVRLPKKDDLAKYVGGASIEKIAFVVSYEQLPGGSGASVWGGVMPSGCPDYPFKLCGDGDCYVTGRFDPDNYEVTLGTNKMEGGCTNKPLREKAEKPMTVYAWIKLSDGTVRKMVVMAAPKSMTKEVLIIVGCVVGVLVLAVLLAATGYYANKNGHCKGKGGAHHGVPTTEPDYGVN